MSNAQKDADAEVPRRSFLGDAVAAVAGLALTPAVAACRQTNSVTTAADSEFAKELDTFIKRLVAEDTFSGAVLVARDGFGVALRAHKLLNPAYTETVLAGKVEYRPNAKYAYGFANDIVNGQRVVFHDSGANGISAEFDMFPDLGYTLVVLSNFDHPASRPVVRKAQELIAGGSR